MPDLDWEQPAVQDAIGAVFDRWLEAGADGYRLDAVLMLVEEGEVVRAQDGSHAPLAALYARTRRAPRHLLPPRGQRLGGRGQRLLARRRGRPRERRRARLPPPRRSARRRRDRRGTSPGGSDRHPGPAGRRRRHGRLPGQPRRGPPGFDVVPDPEARRALRVAQLLLPGAPVLYYGEELDLPNASTGTGQDYAMRAPMPWSDGPGAGFSTGNPWFPPDPGYLEGRNVAEQDEDPEEREPDPLALLFAGGAWPGRGGRLGARGGRSWGAGVHGTRAG
ncbi:MAG: hypothetical protein IPK67_19575 [Planctomycetes bacterium]|nr:hypothetical protein [Planctomycetota bacterium]